MKTIRIIALTAAALGLAGLSSCNTSRGFGQDLQKAGSEISQSAVQTGGTGTR